MGGPTMSADPAVVYWPSLRRAPRSVTLAKLRKSWTGRPTTTIERTQITAAKAPYRWGGIVGHAERCTTELECAVQRAAEDHSAPYPHQNLTVGVIT